VTTKDNAEAWVEGRRGLSFENSMEGECIIFNAWAASSQKVNRFLLDQARKIMEGKETVYFKRYYKDGTTRPSRLRVNEFVAQHLGRKNAGAD
jgi:hypothetical protein